MADILPEPSDSTPIYQPTPTSKRAVRQPLPRRTLSVLLILVIAAALSLIGGYIYDLVNNNSQNNTEKQDVSYVTSNLNGYYSLYGEYPTLTQVNADNSSFSVFNPSLNRHKYEMPSSKSEVLVAEPSSKNYAYEAGPANCNDTTIKCSSYKVVAVLTDGSDYTVSKPSTSK